MEFDASYYKSEVRDGFYVSSKMKRTWAATLEVFKAIEKVCVDNGITYYADWGTMLGAVRHRGFVPWDDDFDICMMRDDYMRFIELAKYQLPTEYYLLNVYNDSEYDETMTRVVNRKEISFGRNYMKEYHGFPYNAGVDVFPLDYINDNESAEKARCDLAMMLYRYIKEYDHIETEFSKSRDEIYQIAEGIGFTLYEGKPVRQQLYQMMDKIFSIYGPSDGNRVAMVAMTISYHNKPIPVEMYKKTILIPFENTKVVVPVLYDEMLELKYNNYIKCIRSWDTHGYPVYEGLEEEVHKAGRDDVWPNYSIKNAKGNIDEQIVQSRTDKLNESYEKKEIVFMPYSIESWKWLEPYWAQLQKKEEVITYVMPIPYYDKDECGDLGEFHYEGGKFTFDVPIIAFDEYDIEKRHPAQIIIQFPYDQYDTAMSIPPFFYTERIRKFTDCLCYIPDFRLDEFGVNDDRAIKTMDFFCINPGVINSDLVYVQSENMRSRFIEKLGEFAGKDTAQLWEKKIRTITWDMPEPEKEGLPEEEVPDEWWNKLINKEGTGKKIILYYTSMSCLIQYKERYIEKFKEVFEIFERNAETITVLMVPDIDAVRFEEFQEYENIILEYTDLIEEYKEKQNVIVYRDEFPYKAVAISDAFYGDRGYLMHMFERTGRPIMIQNVEITA